MVQNRDKFNIKINREKCIRLNGRSENFNGESNRFKEYVLYDRETFKEVLLFNNMATHMYIFCNRRHLMFIFNSLPQRSMNSSWLKKYH